MDETFIETDLANKKQFKKLKEKIKRQDRINLFFPIDYSGPSYYYLYQLLSLSKFSQYNIHFYIAITDTILSGKTHDHFPELKATKKNVLIDSSLKEIKIILTTFGIPKENIHLYRYSDIWSKFIAYNSQNVIDFHMALSIIKPAHLKIPKDIISKWYLPSKTTYTMNYGMQKIMDIYSAQLFHKLYRDEIIGKLDGILISPFGRSTLSKFQKKLKQANIIPNDSTLPLYFKAIPCFGHTSSIEENFSVPNWNMSPEFIAKIVNRYKVKKNHIQDIFKNVILPYSNEHYSLKSINSLKTNYSKRQKDEQLRKYLAESLYKFLSSAKEKCTKGIVKDSLILEKESDIQEIIQEFRSDLAIKIITLSNGKYSISELAHYLDKHVANISKIVKRLKKKNIIHINHEGKLEKQYKSIKLVF